MEAKKQRLNIEKKIKNDFFNIKIGTVNRLNPQVIYFEIRTFISPLEEYDNYNFIFSSLRKNLSKNLMEKLNGNYFFNKNFILDFQVANSGVKINKKSYLTFQIFLKQNDDSLKNLKEIKKICEPLITEILDDLKKNILSYNFLIAKTKKENIYY